MCRDCGSRDPGRRFSVDGTGALLCAECVRDTMQIGWAHEQVRRLHRAAHGFDSPCPICEDDAWLAGQRLLEAAETASAELDAVMDRLPQPMAFEGPRR